MVNLELTERQAEYLNDIIDMWIEGYPGAVKEVQSIEQAPMFDTAEDLLQTVDTLNWQHADAVDLKLKLVEARRNGS